MLLSFWLCNPVFLSSTFLRYRYEEVSLLIDGELVSFLFSWILSLAPVVFWEGNSCSAYHFGWGWCGGNPVCPDFPPLFWYLCVASCSSFLPLQNFQLNCSNWMIQISHCTSVEETPLIPVRKIVLVLHHGRCIIRKKRLQNFAF